ncbi:hypothetical protein RB195_003351 [Necator americanus]|uniref:Uncharacterized protein n=1 Tax=Necator americanus TaxID=51031 RepID=A0ABR1DPJ3_NECAM
MVELNDNSDAINDNVDNGMMCEDFVHSGQVFVTLRNPAHPPLIIRCISGLRLYDLCLNDWSVTSNIPHGSILEKDAEDVNTHSCLCSLMFTGTDAKLQRACEFTL